MKRNIQSLYESTRKYQSYALYFYSIMIALSDVKVHDFDGLIRIKVKPSNSFKYFDNANAIIHYSILSA